ncbi:MAG: hypothetical protein AB7G23_19910 [Vicinamibacterales bacterium]
MTYELNTVYRPVAPSSDDDYRRVWETFRAAGANSGTALTALTGPLVGCTAMSSRWDSLDAMAGWWADMAARLRDGGDLHDVAVKGGATVTRVLSTDVAELGTCSGAYQATSRLSLGAVRDAVFQRGASLAAGAGCNGARLVVLTVGGEWTGQHALTLYTDSLDALPAASAAWAADEQFSAEARADGIQRISTTYFNVVSRL